ncbi:MAG: MarR family winged helix-turn-helix transcriptional regulator [Streptomycetales bacterium]
MDSGVRRQHYPGRRPTSGELSVWRMFLRAYAQLTRRLEADLIAEHALSLASYDLLVTLVEAPDHRLRMTELAEQVFLSRSGLSRHVDRLAREGLVTREACLDDGRGTFAVLTRRGYERLRDAAHTHLRGIAAYATGGLSDEELRLLGTILGKLVVSDAPPAR